MDLKIKTEKEEFHVRACGIINQVNKISYHHISGGHTEIE